MAHRLDTSLFDAISDGAGPSRLEDAVRIAPHLTHVVRHHGQITLIPPEDTGRIWKPKKKQPDIQTRETSTSYSPRPRDDPTHVSRRRSYKSAAGNLEYPQPLSSQRNNRIRSSRARKHEDDLLVPDFPPPSFEETMLSSSSSSNTMALVPAGSQRPRSGAVGEGTSTSTVSVRAMTSDGSSQPGLNAHSRSASDWEEDRLAGLTLEERVRRELDRKRQAMVMDIDTSTPIQTQSDDAMPCPITTRDECKEDTSPHTTKVFVTSEELKGKRRDDTPPSPSTGPSPITGSQSFHNRIRYAAAIPLRRMLATTDADISEGWVMVPDSSAVQIPQHDDSHDNTNVPSDVQPAPSSNTQQYSSHIRTTHAHCASERQPHSSPSCNRPPSTRISERITHYESLLSRPVPEPPVQKAPSRRPPPIPPRNSRGVLQSGVPLPRLSPSEEQIGIKSIREPSHVEQLTLPQASTSNALPWANTEPSRNPSSSIVTQIPSIVGAQIALEGAPQMSSTSQSKTGRDEERNGSSILSYALDNSLPDENLVHSQPNVSLPVCTSSPQRTSGRMEAYRPTDDGNTNLEGRSSSTTVSVPDEFIPRPLQPMFTGPTDLDLLLARLEDVDTTSGGRSYDDLLLLEEIIGPAACSQASNRRQALLDEIPCGKVEVLRRRVTKHGRRKLKLALLGVVVNKCGICLNQFKEGAEAGLLPCQHVYHGACLSNWLRRSESCPMRCAI